MQLKLKRGRMQKRLRDSQGHSDIESLGKRLNMEEQDADSTHVGEGAGIRAKDELDRHKRSGTPREGGPVAEPAATETSHRTLTDKSKREDKGEENQKRRKQKEGQHIVITEEERRKAKEEDKDDYTPTTQTTKDKSLKEKDEDRDPQKHHKDDLHDPVNVTSAIFVRPVRSAANVSHWRRLGGGKRDRQR